MPDIFTACIFDGPPPRGYSSWTDWVESILKTGGKIQALDPPKPEGDEWEKWLKDRFDRLIKAWVAKMPRKP